MEATRKILTMVAGAALIVGWFGLGFSPGVFAAETAGGVPVAAASKSASYNPAVCDRLTNAMVRDKKIYQKCLRGGSSNGISKGDFNGDGFADLAIGVPGKDIGSSGDAGEVVVIYGSVTGLNPAGGNGIPASQLWRQNDLEPSGVSGTRSNPNDRFGSALAAGDFNGDGYSDLAIGAPGEDLGIPGDFENTGSHFFPSAGQINVIYGSVNGLSTLNNQRFTDPDDTGLIDNEHFGAALAWGDFDNDGFGDLAIGIPNKSYRLFLNGTGNPSVQVSSAGGVLILRGSANGLTGVGQQAWNQGSLAGGREDGDQFGAAVAGGDFNGDGFGDLAVGVPGEGVGSNTGAGAVNIIYGSATGLTASGNQRFHKDSPGIIDFAAVGQGFGRVLAAGDFNGDRRSDLAVGVPRHNLGSANQAGSVSVIYGSANGLTAEGNEILTQARLFSSTVEVPETGDNFGSALAAGDFNGDGRADLAIGVPNEDVSSARLTNVPVVDAGAVNVVYGAATGLDRNAGPGAQIWHQEKLNGALEVGDRFGSSLTAWNFGRNLQTPRGTIFTFADLAIGVPFEDVLAPGSTDPTQQIRDAGAVNVIYGSFTGLSVSGGLSGPGQSQLWVQGFNGVPGIPNTSNLFGSAVY